MTNVFFMGYLIILLVYRESAALCNFVKCRIENKVLKAYFCVLWCS